jgi:hypothetical protein
MLRGSLWIFVDLCGLYYNSILSYLLISMMQLLRKPQEPWPKRIYYKRIIFIVENLNSKAFQFEFHYVRLLINSLHLENLVSVLRGESYT